MFDANEMRFVPVIVSCVTSDSVLAGKIAETFDFFQERFFDEDVFAIGEKISQGLGLLAIRNADKRGVVRIEWNVADGFVSRP